MSVDPWGMLGRPDLAGLRYWHDWAIMAEAAQSEAKVTTSGEYGG